MAMTNKIIISLLFFIAIHLQIKGQELVDLGLPSGIKWATCNLGSNKPEETGDYYAWGETKIKNKYKIDNYKYYNSHISFLKRDKLKNVHVTKYCTEKNINHELYYNSLNDNKVILEAIDDVANKERGEGWRLPTKEDFEELFDNCKCKYEVINGKKCLVLSGKKEEFKNRRIIIPTSFLLSNQTYHRHKKENKNIWEGKDNELFYWTSSLSMDSNSKHAIALHVDKTGSESYLNIFRFIGMPIRPVFDK